MHRLSLDEVVDWAARNAEPHYVYPVAVSATCPNCRTACVFDFDDRVDESLVGDIAPASCRCPRCSASVGFVLVGAGFDRSELWGGELWMTPAPPTRTPLLISGLVPERIVRHYAEAIANYESGRWQSATQVAGVVLEGVVKDQLDRAGASSSGRGLGEDLKLVAQNVELALPLTDAADALRLVRNLASHYDQRGEVTEDLASEMFDLLDTVLQYLLLVPAQVSRLKDRLRQDESADDPASARSTSTEE